MVFRKPYALLIKYFQRLHIILLLAAIYLFYNTTTLRSFVSDFLTTQSYNREIESISRYIGGLTFLVIILIVAMVITIMVLLRHKKKPWKIYLLPLVEYIFLFGVMLFIRSYFAGYNEYSTVTSIMAGRDLLFIAYIPQFLCFILFGVRLLGVDLKRFGFKEDEEYLAIKEEDREEFEVNIEIDKEKIKRNFKKLWRNIKYVYAEHKFVCNSIITIIVAVSLGYTYYYFGVLHKTYKQGASFTANGYQIKVDDSYLTNRNMNGELLDEKSKYSYVIVNLTVKNLASNSREMNIDRFRLMNKSEEGILSLEYAKTFSGYGTAYDKREIAAGKTKTFALIYKVLDTLEANRYVLYYQSTDSRLLIKKTSLSVKDYRTIESGDSKQLGEELIIDEEDFTITNYTIGENATYYSYTCNENGCGVISNTASSYNKLILQIDFISDYFDSKSFIDFSTRYAKIKYEDKEGNMKVVNVENALSRDSTSNALFLSVPKDIIEYQSLSIVYTKDGKEYNYVLKEKEG